MCGPFYEVFMENFLALLQALERVQGEKCPVSALVSALDTDGNAIQTAAETLIEQGYPIRRSGQAIRMDPDEDRISAPTLSVWLPDRPIFAYETIGSTNTEARRQADAPLGTLFVAEAQTAGRGRTGKQFFSPKNSGLYMSLVLAAPAPERLLLATPAAAVAVCEAVEALLPIEPKIKWLNDLYLGSKKVCGILTEAVTDAETGKIQRIIVGIGINCRQREFPPELAKIAGSLEMKGLSRSRLAGEIVRRLESWMQHLDDEALMDAYRARSLMPGRKVQYRQNGQSFCGTVQGLDGQCHLLVKLDNGKTAALDSGEVQITDWESEKTRF